MTVVRPLVSVLLLLVPGAAVAQAVDTLELAVAGAVAEGDSVPIRAVARDSAGREVSGVPINWFSNAPAVGDILPNGTLVAYRAGRVAIGAFAGGK
ncbi:MAG TPA: hypothetical protein VNK43_09000, partial [Gemmatimonadales bacterium]|nr:hypothetical protein [Gemmatimonadales bacterium]